MGIFSGIKKYRKPLTEIDEKIRQLNEITMTAYDFYGELDDAGQPWDISEPSDEKMGDLADTDSFSVADQTGSSPDMSQLSATDANGDTVNLLATADDASGGGGLGIIRYGSFGANGGTFYAVLKSDNTTGASFLTGAISGNGGDAAVGAFVDKYGDSATGVTWHYYRTPGLADNAFTPIARNVGPGGAYTLWSCSLLVVKNPNFVNQVGRSATFTRYGLGDSRYFYLRSKGRGSSRGISRALLRFGNTMRGVGGFVGDFYTAKELYAGNRGGRPLDPALYAASMRYRFSSGPGTQHGGSSRPISVPRQVSPVPPDLPGYDDAPVDMPQIEPDPKPTPKPVPPGTPPPEPDPKPTPTPTPKPTPTPTPPRRGTTHTPSPKDLASVGAKTPPPPPGYGDRGKFFDDYYTGTIESSGNDYVDKVFSKTKIPTAVITSRTTGRAYIFQVKGLAKSLTKAEESLKRYENMELPSGDSFTARMMRAHIETETLNRKAEVEKLKRTIIEVQGEINQQYLNSKNDFEQGGSVPEYIETYKDSHFDQVKDVVDQEITKVPKVSVNDRNGMQNALKGIFDTIGSIGQTMSSMVNAGSAFGAFLLQQQGIVNYTEANPYKANMPAQDKQNISNALSNVLKDIPRERWENLSGDDLAKVNAALNPGKGKTPSNPFRKDKDRNIDEYHNIFNNIGRSDAFKGKIKTDKNGNPYVSGIRDTYVFENDADASVPGAPGLINFFANAGGAQERMQKGGEKLYDYKTTGELDTSDPNFKKWTTAKKFKTRNMPIYMDIPPPNSSVKESYLQESLEFEKQIGVSVDHVSNVMNGVADSIDVLNNCIVTLHESSRKWKRPANNPRYEVDSESTGSPENPLEIVLSENANQYLLTNPNTGEPYNPQTDGRLSKFILTNAYRGIDLGGNIAARSVISNFTKVPEVVIDNEENIIMLGQIYLFNSKRGIEHSIMSQVLSAVNGITEIIGFSIDGFSERWNEIYEQNIRKAFVGIDDLDKEIPVLNVILKIPFDQAHLYTMNGYLQSPENVEESMMGKWKKRTSPENRFKQGEHEFFLSALSSIPKIAQNYIKIELQMQLEQLLLPENQQMDPKMIQVQSMVNANNVYIDNHFPENEKLFKKLKKRIQKNIDDTNPETYQKPVKVKEDMSIAKQKSMARHLKKEYKRKDRPAFLTKKRNK